MSKFEVKAEKRGNRRKFYGRRISPMPGLAKPLWLPISGEQFNRMIKDGALDLTPKEV